jgi:hypothetical protein
MPAEIVVLPVEGDDGLAGWLVESIRRELFATAHTVATSAITSDCIKPKPGSSRVTTGF